MTKELVWRKYMQKPFKLELRDHFTKAFINMGLDPKWGEVSVSDRPDLADYQCNGALGASKLLKKNPKEVAQIIKQNLQSELFDFELSIAGPGFINIKIKDNSLGQRVNQIGLDLRMGVPKTQTPKNVIIDFGSPNVAKGMHAGHLRSHILGDFLQRIYRFVGHNVKSDNHLGDWGTPMGMVIAALQELKPDLPYFDPKFCGTFPLQSPVTMSELEEIYPEASKKFKADPDFAKKCLIITDELQRGHIGFKALWSHFVNTTISELKLEYQKLGIEFDLWHGESFYEEMMPKMVEQLIRSGVAVQSEGAWVIELKDQNNHEFPPCILVKSGGGYLYHTSDLAAIKYRKEILGADEILYVVDKRQSLHFSQVFKAAEKSGIKSDTKLEHVAFGTMNGKDGKPFKTRDGGVIRLKDMIQMIMDQAELRMNESQLDLQISELQKKQIAKDIALATLKYADLKNSRLTDYVFDLEQFSKFEGNTGPYLLYTVVRIGSILKKAEDLQFKPGPILPPTLSCERQLYLQLARLSEAIDKSIQNNEAHPLCEHAHELSQKFNFFYKECHIMREEDLNKRASWLQLCKTTKLQFELILDLLGLKAPERM